MPPDVAKNVKVGHGLKSETNQVQPLPWVTEDGTRIKLVDTPGFDDSREGVTDVQVLKMIATFLTERWDVYYFYWYPLIWCLVGTGQTLDSPDLFIFIGSVTLELEELHNATCGCSGNYVGMTR